MSEIFNSPDIDMTTVGVPYIIHESHVARMERANKRLAIIAMVLILALFLTNAAWLWAWLQYDYSSEESYIEVDSGSTGIANYIGNDGNIYNGEDYGD